MSEPTFKPDPQIVEIAEAYALDAMDLASRNIGVSLDWSEQSVRQVEQMLGRLHDELSKAHPPDETVWTFAKAFGSYIGEVIRRRYGGEWGLITLDGKSFPGLKQASGDLVWPWSKAHERLTNGSEDNIWHYYQVLTRTDDSTGAEGGRRR